MKILWNSELNGEYTVSVSFFVEYKMKPTCIYVDCSWTIQFETYPKPGFLVKRLMVV